MHSYKLSCTSFDLQYMQLLSKEIVHNIMFQVQFCSPPTEDAKYKKKNIRQRLKRRSLQQLTPFLKTPKTIKIFFLMFCKLLMNGMI